MCVFFPSVLICSYLYEMYFCVYVKKQKKGFIWKAELYLSPIHGVKCNETLAQFWQVETSKVLYSAALKARPAKVCSLIST